MIEGNENKETTRPGSSLSTRSQLENRTDFQKQLDTLARLLVDNSQEEWDMCVGICLHDEGNGNKLYIASNNETPVSAKEYMENLKEFTQTKSLDSYEKLLNSAVKQIYYVKENTSDIEDKENLNSFQGIVKDYYENKISLQRKPSWKSLPEATDKLLKETIDETKSTGERGKKWQYLIPWYDIGEFADMIESGQTEPQITEIIEVIKKDNSVELVSSPRELTEEEKNENKKFHAEIKIIDKLYKETEEELTEEKYIGLSKPTCAICQATIEILNNEAKAKYKWETCGTHGSDEYKPLMSVIIEDKGKSKEVSERAKEIKIEESKKGDKPKETSSELPNQSTQLSNPVELLKKLQSEELQAQVETPSK